MLISSPFQWFRNRDIRLDYCLSCSLRYLFSIVKNRVSTSLPRFHCYRFDQSHSQDAMLLIAINFRCNLLCTSVNTTLTFRRSTRPFFMFHCFGLDPICDSQMQIHRSTNNNRSSSPFERPMQKHFYCDRVNTRPDFR